MPPTGLVHDSCDYRNKFRVARAVWNPKLDVLALASLNGEVCLKRFYWKTGWQKKVSSELLFYSKDNALLENSSGDIGDFVEMCWSPDGSVLAVAFESGVCHFLDINDALILYTLHVNWKVLSLKWFKLKGLNDDLNDARRKQLFCNEKVVDFVNCEHLRTKDSETQRDNYKILYGIQCFCHSKVQTTLLDTTLVVVGERDGFYGFDVYMSGMFLVKSVIFDCGFLPEVCDTYNLKIHDVCLLSNQNLQFAISCPLKQNGFDVCSEFDLDAGFTQPLNDFDASRESSFIVEYDLQFGDRVLQASSALLAARSCHIFHLMVALRENFERASVDWDVASEQFHVNVFGTLYAKYEEESKGLMADFALDFIAYILTGNYNDAFSHAFFRDIKLKDWKPAREFVVRHIPVFLQSVNKHLIPLVDTLYVHLKSLKGELELHERYLLYESGRFPILQSPNQYGFVQLEPSRSIEQVERTLKAIQHLSKQLKDLVGIGNRNWAELKYVLQVLSSHPENEQLKMDIEDDYDGVPKRVDFEILLNFITDALVDPAKKAQFHGWPQFLHYWKNSLLDRKTHSPTRSLICNPNWLRHRLFDKIGPLLGTCADLPKPKVSSETTNANLDAFSCSQATTIDDAIKMCFHMLSELYLFGIRDLNGNSEQPDYLNAQCFEFCHPASITKLKLYNWTHTFTLTNKFQPCDEFTKNLEREKNLMQQFGIVEPKSLMVIERASVQTLQTYLIVEKHNQPVSSEHANVCAPSNVLKLASFGRADSVRVDPDKLDADELELRFSSRQFKVVAWDLYASGSLHLIVTYNDPAVLINTAAYIVRTDVFGNLHKIDESVITYMSQLSLHSSPSSQIAVLFERQHESLKWFALETNKLDQRHGSETPIQQQRILTAHSVQQIDIPRQSSRAALNRKRKLNLRGDEENRRPVRLSDTAATTSSETIDMNENNFGDVDELDDEENADESIDERLRDDCIVVELEEQTTPVRFSSPTFSSHGSPALLQLNDFASFTSPTHNVPTTPTTGILNIVRFGSPATVSTASSINRVVADSGDDDEEIQAEDQEDFDEDTRTTRANDDDDARTEHDIEVVDLLESSREEDVLTEQHNRQNIVEGQDSEMMEIGDDGEETRQAL